jgi:hypothetical protein
MLLLVPVALEGQILVHPLMSSVADAYPRHARTADAPDTIRTLAVRVQFLTDNDSRTSGKGQFVLSASAADTALDSPPHNAQYFRDHLSFLSNYYGRVSRGRVVVQTTLLDSVITLPAQMARYSPLRNTPNTPVADLARDAWRAVDSLHLVADFSQYRCFIVFHAGAGRDIDLTSELGYDPTPYDIPSLYFGMNGFRALYGQSFQGFAVQGGAVHITNTSVIPETESRFIDPPVSLSIELGINGLLCASFGNFLGLPDLFNTATGASGIGRFGLMDGQGIFSFAGAFPPSLSAWEKYWLGWITPIDITAGPTTVQLPATTLSDSVYRVALSGQEYFLLENRSRDPYRTGVTVTTRLNGTTRVQTFTRDMVGFNEYDVSALAGTVTDVSVPDWSLPGETDADGTFYDGGILIWHIDEAAIDQGLPDNSVNARSRKGVRVVEADGSQDIGQNYGQFTAGSGTEAGYALDYWFRGNVADPYKNSFSLVTLPNSKSNLGSDSHVTISDFSARGPHMTATISVGNASFASLPGFPKKTGQTFSAHPLTLTQMGPSQAMIVSATSAQGTRTMLWDSSSVRAGGVYAYAPTGKAGFPGSSPDGGGLFVDPGLNNDVISGACVLGTTFAVAQNGPSFTGVRFYSTVVSDSANPQHAKNTASVAIGRVSAGPVANDSVVAVGYSNGNIALLSFAGLFLDGTYTTGIGSQSLSVVGFCALPETPGMVAAFSDGTLMTFGTTAHGFIQNSTRTRSIGHPIAAAPVAMGGAGCGQKARIAFTTTDGLLYLTDTGLNDLPGFPVRIEQPVSSSCAFADIDNDGRMDVITFGGKSVYAFNEAGGLLDGFPSVVSSGDTLASSPVIGDVDGDGKQEIIGVTAQGIVGALTYHGSMSPGFPLTAGKGTQDAALLHLTGAGGPGVALVVASSTGGVVAWKTSSSATAVFSWAQYQHDDRRSGFWCAPTLSSAPLSSEFLPKDRAYSWPNPAYNGISHIRYFVRDNASVSIKIYTLAGDLVKELQGSGNGGVDNEVAWDVSGIQSGIYLARIEASGGGTSAVQIVKVAVVK